jgi:hypothetical protein
MALAHGKDRNLQKHSGNGRSVPEIGEEMNGPMIFDVSLTGGREMEDGTALVFSRSDRGGFTLLHSRNNRLPATVV